MWYLNNYDNTLNSYYKDTLHLNTVFTDTELRFLQRSSGKHFVICGNHITFLFLQNVTLFA